MDMALGKSRVRVLTERTTHFINELLRRAVNRLCNAIFIIFNIHFSSIFVRTHGIGLATPTCEPWTLNYHGGTTAFYG